jgi:hypothetical protein
MAVSRNFVVQFHGKLTVKRYSIARSGLKKAARMARSMSVRAKPIASIWATAPSAAEPMDKAEGSPKAGPVWAAPAGEGVAGAADVGGAAAAWGAGGAAGVDTGARGAGVEGT